MRTQSRLFDLAITIYAVVAAGAVLFPWLRLGALGAVSGWEMALPQGRVTVVLAAVILFFSSYNLVMVTTLRKPLLLTALGLVGVLVWFWWVARQHLADIRPVAELYAGQPVGFGVGAYVAGGAALLLLLLTLGSAVTGDRAAAPPAATRSPW